MFVLGENAGGTESIVPKPRFKLWETLRNVIVPSDVGAKWSEMVALRIFGRVERRRPKDDFDSVLL
jgi:hypothetical protein